MPLLFSIMLENLIPCMISRLGLFRYPYTLKSIAILRSHEKRSMPGAKPGISVVLLLVYEMFLF